MSVIDLNTYNSLRETTGAQFVSELIDTFLEDSPNLISQMKKALSSSNADSFRRAAHTLKSNAATFGALQLAGFARELEGMARENNLEIGNRLEVLEEAFQKAKSQLIELDNRMVFPTEPARLLVVDDNKINRMLLSRSLETQGHIVETAENGKEGLEKIRSGAFDLVLLDIEMPEMDGFQVLEACLNDVELRQLPIIMTSAMDELDAVVKCVELGAEDYLTKPINPILLRARVNASLEKKRLRDEQRKLFRTFATKEVAEELLRTGFSLGGKQVTASVLFADIRSFTTIAESQEPAESIELLNEYFSMMFDAITNDSGTVNQLVGDGLMAVFGAPIFFDGHRENAVRAAQQMLEQLKVLNQNRSVQGKSQIRIGIGIASGTMVAGYTGTQTRAIYTCIGDTVNLASRIEEYTKEALHPLLIDNYTRQGLAESIAVEDLGKVFFKGKNHAIKIFAVL